MTIKESAGQVLDLLNHSLIRIGGNEITAATLLIVAAVVVATFIVSRLLRRALARLFRARGVHDDGSLAVASRLLHYAILFLGLSIGLHTMGINLTALFTAGAFFAVAVGFAMQNLTANFVSGLILLIERSITPGDVLEVEGQFFRVKDMGIRSTVARTLDEEDVIIPNSVLVQSTVKNYTLQDSQYRLRTAVGVSYSSDLDLVLSTLKTVAEGVKWRVPKKKPVVRLIAFGSSSVDFEVSVWIEDPWSMRTFLSEMNLAIWWTFKEKGIVIAFPQLDVHFDGPPADIAG